MLYTRPTWGLYHINWVGFNYHKLQPWRTFLINSLAFYTRSTHRITARKKLDTCWQEQDIWGGAR